MRISVKFCFYFFFIFCSFAVFFTSFMEVILMDSRDEKMLQQLAHIREMEKDLLSRLQQEWYRPGLYRMINPVTGEVTLIYRQG